MVTVYTVYLVKSGNCVCSIFALDNWLLVSLIPVLKLALQLWLDHFKMPRVMIPGEVAIHTDHVHVRGLGQERSREFAPHTDDLFKVRLECR